MLRQRHGASVGIKRANWFKASFQWYAGRHHSPVKLRLHASNVPKKENAAHRVSISLANNIVSVERRRTHQIFIHPHHRAGPLHGLPQCGRHLQYFIRRVGLRNPGADLLVLIGGEQGQMQHFVDDFHGGFGGGARGQEGQGVWIARIAVKPRCLRCKGFRNTRGPRPCPLPSAGEGVNPTRSDPSGKPGTLEGYEPQNRV